MPDDVETLQKMVRWLAEHMTSAEESSATYIFTEKMWEQTVQDWINDARKGVTDGI